MSGDVLFSNPLEDLIVVREVQVVKELDFSALQNTLKWILSQVPSKGNSNIDPDDYSQLKSQVATLANDNVHLRAQIQELQGAPNVRQSKDDRVEIPEELLRLPKRVDELESRLNTSRQAETIDQSSTEQSLPPPRESTNGLENSLSKHGDDNLKELLLDLEGRLQEVKANEADIRKALLEKPDKGELNALRAIVDKKASQSELEALLTAGSVNLPSSNAPVIALDGDNLDPKAVSDAFNKMSGDVSGVKGLIAMLQERVKTKAEQPDLEEMQRHLAQLRQSISDLQAQAHALPKAATTGSALSPASVVVAQDPAAFAPAAPSNLADLESKVAEVARRMDSLAALLAASRAPGDSLVAAAAGAKVAGMDDSGEMSVTYNIGGALQADLASKVQALADKLDSKLDKDAAGSLIADAVASKADAPEVASLSHEVGRLTRHVAALSNMRHDDPSGALSLPSLTPQASTELLANGLNAAELAKDLQGQLALKADQETLLQLVEQLRVQINDLAKDLGANKADKAGLDELKLKFAVLAAGDLSDEDRAHAMLSTVQELLQDKANVSDLEDVRALIDQRASIEDLAAMREELAGKASMGDIRQLQHLLSNKPSRDEMDALTQQLIHMDLRPGTINTVRNTVLHSTTPTPATASNPEAMKQQEELLAEISRDILALKDGLDVVSHASNIMGLGIDMGAEGLASPTNSVGPKESRSPKGAYERLLGFLRNGNVHFKMDALDQELLPKMAQKLAGLEAIVKSNAFNRPAQTTTDLGVKDIEKKIGKLIFDMRQLKDRLGDGPLFAPRIDLGDHAILASKPISGYRCMACDRPLERLDEKPGPYVPVHSMPITVAAASDATSRDRARDLAPKVSGPGKKNEKYDPTKRGPQFWYEDGPGLPADQLPKEDVGPHLPPGGWRSATADPTLSPRQGAVSPLPPIKGSLSGAATQVPRSTPLTAPT